MFLLTAHSGCASPQSDTEAREHETLRVKAMQAQAKAIGVVKLGERDEKKEKVITTEASSLVNG